MDDLAGLGSSHPGVALLMVVFLFSLIGIPLTAGFTGKLFVFLGAMAIPGDVAKAVNQTDANPLISIFAAHFGPDLAIVLKVVAFFAIFSALTNKDFARALKLERHTIATYRSEPRAVEMLADPGEIWKFFHHGAFYAAVAGEFQEAAAYATVAAERNPSEPTIALQIRVLYRCGRSNEANALALHWFDFRAGADGRFSRLAVVRIVSSVISTTRARRLPRRGRSGTARRRRSRARPGGASGRPRWRGHALRRRPLIRQLGDGGLTVLVGPDHDRGLLLRGDRGDRDQQRGECCSGNAEQRPEPLV